ncbi:hypothetical protein EMCRGX_G030478 [Ephydatia muelleri]
MASPAIGIDFGTAYLRMAVLRSNTVEMIPNEFQGYKTPIYVAYRENEQSNGAYAVFGDDVKVAAAENLQGTVFGLKRLIGRSSEEKKHQIHENRWPFQVNNQSQLEVVIRGKKKNVSTVKIFSTVFAKAREMASKYLNTEVNCMVVTTPVECSPPYKDETMEAARMAGFVKVVMIDEPYAAALAYQVYEKKEDLQQIQNVIVFHLGGGSFGITVFKLCGSDITTVFNKGDPSLGGLNFDAAIVSWFCKKHGIHQGRHSVQDLAEACEKAKCNLASCNETTVNCKLMSRRSKVEVVNITRSAVEGIGAVQKLLEHIKSIMCEAVQAALPKDKAVVILVGGSTRLLCIEDLVAAFGIKRSRVLNADEAAVIGAAVHAAKISREDAHCASNKDVPQPSSACTDELVLKNPAIEKDEQDRRAKINEIEKTMYKIKRYLQKQPKEQVKEWLETCEKLIVWAQQTQIASTEEIQMMDGRVQELICFVQNSNERTVEPPEPPKPQLQQNALSTSQFTSNGTVSQETQRLPAHVQQSTGNAACTDTELYKEIETLNKSNIQNLQGLAESLKKQGEFYTTLLRSVIVPAPTLESQQKELWEQPNHIDHPLKYFEEHQRNIQMISEENDKYLMHDPTGIVNHLQSFSRQLDEQYEFCVSLHHLLKKQRVAIQKSILTLLQANNPPS